MKTLRFTTLPGDGIGPEVMDIAINVLQKSGEQNNFQIETQIHDVGGVGIDKHGSALPKSTLNACKNSDAILFGSVGGPKWENLPPKEQPERAALLPLRKAFELFANLRPGTLYPELADLSPLRSDTASNGIDVLCVRELTGGIYFGQPKSTSINKMVRKKRSTPWFIKRRVERITEIAVRAAALRDGRICSVDKANVLETSVLWRKWSLRVLQSLILQSNCLTCMLIMRLCNSLETQINLMSLLLKICLGISSLMNWQSYVDLLEC